MTAVLARPIGLIEATVPPERRGIKRDAVGMLVTDRATRQHTHEHFFDLPSILRPSDLLVVNDSATIPAALRATRPNGESIALHVATRIDQRIWMTEPRATVLSGEELQLPDGGSVVMIAPVEPACPRLWYAWFQLPTPMYDYLNRVGEPIRYRYVTQRFPIADYQTIFARKPGSSEMPSAARPFTPRVVRVLKRIGVETAAVTLHCGVSSFEQPERPATEHYTVTTHTVEAITAARRDGRRVIAVGTTVLRALESAAWTGELTPSSGWTDLVIDGDHRIRTVDGLLTGFHEPGATHQGLLRAFLDPQLLESAYDEAAERSYYYHEFGDVHLIL